MAAALYSRDILRLATALVHNDHLDGATGIAEVRSPVCGSVMAAELRLDDKGAIEALALRANACALGQASAAIVRANAVGQPLDTVQSLRTALANALAGKAEMPTLWDDLALLAPARDVPARHAAILLPYDAILAAATNSREKADV